MPALPFLARSRPPLPIRLRVCPNETSLNFNAIVGEAHIRVETHTKMDNLSSECFFLLLGLDIESRYWPMPQPSDPTAVFLEQKKLTNHCKEVERAIDNLVKSGKMFGGLPRREFAPFSPRNG